MSTVQPDDISLFRYADDMPGALWDDLDERPAAEATINTGAQYEDGVFTIDFFNRPYRVDTKARTVSEVQRPDYRVSYQTAVVLVSTLGRALPVEPSGQIATPHELPGGSLFFTGPHEIYVDPIIERFADDPQALLKRAEALGGGAIEGADAAIKVPALPKVDLYALLWTADDEFESRVVVGVDSRAIHHLALDGIYALFNVGIHRLTR